MITQKQKRVLDFIRHHETQKGYAPVLEDIRKAFDLASVSTAHFHVSRLREAGYLDELKRIESVPFNAAPNEEYQEQPLNTIICGDAVEILRKLPSNSVDLVVTSPPYDELRNYNGYSFDFENIAKELFRVVKQGGVVVWVVGDATINGTETGTSFKHALFFKETGFNLHDTMIFQKQNPIPQIYRKRYNNQFEYMFVFSKGVVKTHNPIMVDCLHAGLQLNGTTYKNYSKNVQEREKLAKPVKDKKIKGNIWTYVVGKNKEDQESKGHPAPFPCQLAQDHIMSWTNEGDVVLDPMCGSGTTCKMAKRLHRDYVGIDISDEYCKLAEERIQKENNSTLFSTSKVQLSEKIALTT